MSVKFSTSTAADGPMGRSYDLTHEARANREKFLRSRFGVDPARVATAHLCHGTRVLWVEEKDAGTLVPECDGLITQAPQLPLCITTQDCVPVFCWDRKQTTVGIFHAGWQGIVAGILLRGIETFVKFGISPRDIFLTLGPTIGPCHYEVKNDVASLFGHDYPDSVSEGAGKIFLDLRKALFAQAISSGTPEGNIPLNAECTYCAHDAAGFKYFSWRREHERENNLLSAIALVP